jgi:hypothetical protein
LLPVRAPAALAATLVLALVGCGGDDTAAESCRENQRKAAELAVIAHLYDTGELGPKSEIRVELDGMARTNGVDPFFDADGRLLSWYELEPGQRSLLARWWANDPDVDRVAFDARTAARERIEPDC